MADQPAARSIKPYFAKYLPSNNPPDPGFCLSCVADTHPWYPPPLSDEVLLKRRNHAIVACLVEIGSCLCGLALATQRKNIFTNLMNGILLIVTLAGLYGCIKIHPFYVLGHCVLVPGLALIFMIYLTFEILFVEKDGTEIVLLMHLFFLADFFFAYFSYRFWSHLHKRQQEAEAIAKGNMPADRVEVVVGGQPEAKRQQILAAVARRLDSPANNNNIDPSQVCIICCNPAKRKNAQFQPCGHVEACLECAREYMQDMRPCPVCREDIQNVVDV